MRRASTAYKIGHAAVLMPLVVVYMPGENYDAEGSVSLVRLQNFRQRLLMRPSRMSAAKFLLVRRTGIGRMVVHDKHEVNVLRNMIEVVQQPLALRSGNLIERAVEHQSHRVG